MSRSGDPEILSRFHQRRKKVCSILLLGGGGGTPPPPSPPPLHPRLAKHHTPKSDGGIGRILLLILGVGVIYALYAYFTSMYPGLRAGTLTSAGSTHLLGRTSTPLRGFNSAAERINRPYRGRT